MEMVIVEISVPAINKKFDFKLPSTSTIREVNEELVRVLQVTERNVEFDPEVLLLCDLERSKVLKQDRTVAEHHITDGSRLLLI